MANKNFSVICNDAGGAAPQTLANIIGSTAVRPYVYEFDVGCSAAPADQAGLLVMARTTAVGTAGSNPTPAQADPGTAAAVCTAGIAHSAEPTFTSPFVYQVPLNQRATWRWVANPGFEVIGSLTASNGIGLKRHTSTASYALTGTIFFSE